MRTLLFIALLIPQLLFAQDGKNFFPRAAYTNSLDVPATAFEGLLDYYTFDSVHTDSIGGLTLSDLLFDPPSFVTGKIGNAVQFAPGNFYYGHIDHANYSMGTGISKSWSYWFFSRDNNFTISHVNQDDASGAPGYESYVDTDSKLLFRLYAPSGSSTVKTTSTISQDAWHHVVATYDSATTTLKVYLDGTLEDTNSSATNGRDSDEDFIVGGDGGGTGGDFDIDELGVWDRALTGDEVTYINNGGNGRQP